MENLKILKEILELKELHNSPNEALQQLEERFKRDITLLEIKLPEQMKIANRDDTFFDFIHEGDIDDIYFLDSIEFKIEFRLTPHIGLRNGTEFKAHPIIRFNHFDSMHRLTETSFMAKNKIEFFERLSPCYASIQNNGYDSDETILTFEKREDFAKIRQYLQTHIQELLDFFKEAF